MGTWIKMSSVDINTQDAFVSGYCILFLISSSSAAIESS